MTPTLRKRLLIGASGIVGLLIVALLAAPALIDVNSYKPEIIAQVKKATGRDLVLDGPISLSLLPMPTVTIDGVKFFNVQGSKNPNMVEVKSVTVKPALGALLTGSLEVSEVTLVEPKIVLEINAEGKPNWEFTPSVAEAKPAAPKPSSAKPLSLGRLTIENGTLIFSDSKAGLLGGGREGQFQRLGQFAGRALFPGRRRHYQWRAAEDSTFRSAPRGRRATPPRWRWRRAAANSPSRAR